MAAREIRKGDIGTVFEYTIYDGSTIVDVSTTSSKLLKFFKPDKSIVSKTASFVTDGTDGKIKYTTVSGDLDQAGPWKVQAVLTFSGGEVWSSDIDKVTIHPNLADLQ